MQRFLCGRLVLILIGIVGLLQVIHIILLNRLESRQRKNVNVPQPAFEESLRIHNGGDKISEEVSASAIYVERNWVLDSGGEYHISLLQPYSRDVLGEAEDVTLVTQCSQDHLPALISLAHQWKGPMSVAVFARLGQEWSTLLELAKLRLSDEFLRSVVVFSFVWPVSAVGGLPPKPISIVQPNVSESNYNHSEAYPNNLLRNTARRASFTDFIFVIDVDMVPSDGLRQDFLHLARQNNWFQQNITSDRTVFVVPAFEGVSIPKTKQGLIHAVEIGEVRPFYSQLCWKCHSLTDYKAWLHLPLHPLMSPSYDVLWKDPWEPFYISLNSVPLYDERFKQYGFNRISQVCELHVAGYRFTILNNAFIVHNGFKTKESFHPRKEEELELNRRLYRQFKSELRSKYAESSRRCY